MNEMPPCSVADKIPLRLFDTIVDRMLTLTRYYDDAAADGGCVTGGARGAQIIVHARRQFARRHI